jgi:hypothetical protein
LRTTDGLDKALLSGEFMGDELVPRFLIQFDPTDGFAVSFLKKW